jgi:hypothetical protein
MSQDAAGPGPFGSASAGGRYGGGKFCTGTSDNISPRSDQVNIIRFPQKPPNFPQRAWRELSGEVEKANSEQSGFQRCLKRCAKTVASRTAHAWVVSLFVGELSIVSPGSPVLPCSSPPVFYWGALRLDADPLGRHPHPAVVLEPCPDGTPDCVEFDPEFIWVVPGLGERVLEIAALPAFLFGCALVVGLGRLGLNQVLTFMFLMPMLLCAWFCFLGWLLDRWRYKRNQPRSASAP